MPPVISAKSYGGVEVKCPKDLPSRPYYQIAWVHPTLPGWAMLVYTDRGEWEGAVRKLVLDGHPSPTYAASEVHPAVITVGVQVPATKPEAATELEALQNRLGVLRDGS